MVTHLGNEITVVKEDDSDEKMASMMVAAWREVCDLFDGIKELFDNNEIYNLLSLYKMWK